MRQKQLKLKPEAPPVRSSLIVQRAHIPTDLTEAEKRVLRAHLDLNANGQSFFFWDTPEVRRTLRMRHA